jgi:hypothetical protein
MNKKSHAKEVSIEEFIEAIRKLPKHEHRERWIRWLSDYDKPGPFNRQAGEKRSAKFAYNNLAYPEMLLWLIQAAGIENGLVDMAKSDSEQFDNIRRKAAAIRNRVPWEELERLLWG